MGPLTWAFAHVRERGLLNTVKVAASAVADVTFDWRYGTSTSEKVNWDQLGSTSQNLIHSRGYNATKARPLLALLKMLELPSNGVFVDFGSGRGRALMIAALHGFRRIVGVEFSPALHESADRNIRIFLRATGLRAHIDLIQSDVTAYIIEADQNVFFMFNPFDAVVMTTVLSNIRASIARAPRRVWLIYCTPWQHEVVEGSRLFKSQSLVEIGGCEFRVYTNG